MIRTALARLSPSGPRARLNTLIFHRVLAERDELSPSEVTAKEFDAVCGWLKHWFNVLPLDEAVPRLARGALPSRAACITFDDGYADNFEVALPILKKHGLPATFFIATGFLEGGRMWNDTLIEAVRLTSQIELDLSDARIEGLGRVPVVSTQQRRSAINLLLGAIKHLPQQARLRAVNAVVKSACLRDDALPSSLMMRPFQVRALRQSGMQIGAHTVNHPILAILEDEEARAEIQNSRDHLQEVLDAPVPLFAYPNGRPGEDYTRRDVELVRDLGFRAAVSTAWGTSSQQTDCFQIPRFTPWDRTRLKFGLRLARNTSGPALT